MSQSVIVVFQDNVSEEQVKKHADDIVANGGQVGKRYYESGGINGFSATIPNQYLTAFQSLKGDQINYIEPDGVVTTQMT